MAELNFKDYPILFIDDEVLLLLSYKMELQDDFTVFTTNDTDEALEIIKNNKIAVVISDQKMPKMTGIEFFIKLQQSNPEIVRILITGYTEMDLIIKAINSGGIFKFIEKPFDSGNLIAIIKEGIKKYQLQDENLSLMLNTRQLFFSSMETLVRAIDARVPSASDHSSNVSRYSLLLAKELDLDNRQLGEIELTSLLHDIGRLGIPEILLNKEGPLTEEEFSVIKKHSLIGFQLLQTLKELKKISTLIKYHHEKFNGKGYPDGLTGNNIPFESRIISIADAYDAITSNRPYRLKQDHCFAVREIEKNSGSQFDDQLVSKFLKISRDSLELSEKNESFLKYFF